MIPCGQQQPRDWQNEIWNMRCVMIGQVIWRLMSNSYTKVYRILLWAPTALSSRHFELRLTESPRSVNMRFKNKVSRVGSSGVTYSVNYEKLSFWACLWAKIWYWPTKVLGLELRSKMRSLVCWMCAQFLHRFREIVTFESTHFFTIRRGGSVPY